MGLLDFFIKKNIVSNPIVLQQWKKVEMLNLNGQVVPYASTALTWVNEGFKGNGDVYSIVTDIAQRAAQAPIDLYKITKKANQKSLKVKSELTQIENSPVLDFLQNPNSYQNLYEFSELAYVMVLILGEVFIMNLEIDGVKLGLHLFAPFEIDIETKGFRKAVAYKIKNMPDVSIPANQVLHIKLPNIDLNLSYLPTRGLSPLEPASMTLQKANSIEESATYLNENKGAVGAVYIDDADVGEGANSELSSAWEKKAYGTGKAGKIIWSNSRLGFVSFVQTADQLKIVDNAKYSTEQLCRVFHYPSLLLSNESKTMDNYKVAVKQLLIQAVIPLQQRFLEKLSDWLLPMFTGLNATGYCLKADTQAYPELQDNVESTVNSLKDAYWLTINEKREWMEYDEISEQFANELLIPSGYVPISQLNLEPPAGELENDGDF